MRTTLVLLLSLLLGTDLAGADYVVTCSCFPSCNCKPGKPSNCFEVACNKSESPAGSDSIIYTVTNKQSQFTVTNRQAVPTDPSQPAPAGMQWQKVGDGPWQLVAAPGVAARPFQNRPAITPATTARNVAGTSSSSLVSTGTARTITLVPTMGQLGGTSYCSPSG